MAEFKSAIMYIYPLCINNMDFGPHPCYLQNYLKSWKAPPMAYNSHQVQTEIRMAKNGNVRPQSVRKYQREIKHDG